MIIIIKKNIQVNLRMPSKQIDGLKFNKKKLCDKNAHRNSNKNYYLITFICVFPYFWIFCCFSSIFMWLFRFFIG